MDKKTREIREVARGLRKAFPLGRKLRIRTRRLPQPGPDDGAVYGVTGYSKKTGFTITLHPTLNLPMALELLIHEYAHCMTWDETPDHGVAWARAYAKVRQWFQGEGKWAENDNGTR